MTFLNIENYVHIFRNKLKTTIIIAAIKIPVLS